MASHATEQVEPGTSYYEPADLNRFADVGQFASAHMQRFWAYYSEVFSKDGALTTREKALIGLALACADQCPYAAYQHWWASINHPVGAISYFLLVTLALYVIHVQTHIGMQTARIAAMLPRLVQLEVNWINPDDHYGWEPLYRIFRTVWLSMALYGLLVSGLAVVLDLGGGGWIPALCWFVLLCVYFVLPSVGIRRIETAARKRRIAIVLAEAEGASTWKQDKLADRVERYRTTRIRPMRLGSFARIPALVSVLLPVLLNIIRPYVEYWFRR